MILDRCPLGESVRTTRGTSMAPCRAAVGLDCRVLRDGRRNCTVSQLDAEFRDHGLHTVGTPSIPLKFETGDDNTFGRTMLPLMAATAASPRWTWNGPNGNRSACPN